MRCALLAAVVLVRGCGSGAGEGGSGPDAEVLAPYEPACDEPPADCTYPAEPVATPVNVLIDSVGVELERAVQEQL